MQVNPSDIISDIALSNIHLTVDEILNDYRLMYRSRQVSLLGRREVLTGKAKFGIFGDGKELAQLAMAKVFRNGDIRSGYYRDQTFGFATGIISIREFFSQLYADINVKAEPHSGGRQMNNHLATRILDAQGKWKNLTEFPISSADVSCTASQMPRLVGLAHASVLYRNSPVLEDFIQFSQNGDEVVFGTIGNASCAEGHFWEAINALGVLQAPAIVSIWDDEYGISVPNEYQITKSNLSVVLTGFQREEDKSGIEIFTVKGWDYLGLVETYRKAEKLARDSHIPCVIHVTEMTQPQGHSTSGSHERYKSEERLQWEKENDCLTVFRAWILENSWIDEKTLKKWEDEERKFVKEQKNKAWKEYQKPLLVEKDELINISWEIAQQSAFSEEIKQIISTLRRNTEPFRKDLIDASLQILVLVKNELPSESVEKLRTWKNQLHKRFESIYDSYLIGDNPDSALRVEAIEAVYSENPPNKSGYEIINLFFDRLFERDPRVIAFGEDVGQLGDVNQGFAGLQEKYGSLRIMDTGIRENTIMGQAIGMALRGLRPIAEIQYLDYLIYGLQILSDDLATLNYRTAGGQKAPAIIRTRGHRLEGIWHAGSPLGMIIHALRGIHVIVPRNMTQAVGFYNTLLKGDEPGLIIEVLNGYRLKEPLPDNLHDITIPLGIPEIIREGKDVTVVTYGACCRIAMDAAQQLEDLGISVEVIDVQTLLPFDRNHMIVESLKKTNRIILLDEDVPGGATAYMMQQVLEVQGGYKFLDSPPVSISSKDHRCAYGTDGDFWSKPQVIHVFEAIYEMMNEVDPGRYSMFY